MLRPVLVAIVVALSASTSLAAVDAEDFARRLTESVTDRTSIVLSYDTARQDGDDVVIEDMTYLPTRHGTFEDGDFPSVDVRFNDVRGSAANGFVASSISVPSGSLPLSLGAHQLTIAIDGVSATGLAIPGENETGVIDGSIRIDEANIRSLSLSSAEGVVLSIDGARMQTRTASPERTISSASLSRFSYDISTLLDAADRGILDELGLATGQGRVSIGGSYDETTGTARLQGLQVTMPGVGSVDLSYVIENYDRTVFDRVRDVNRALADGRWERIETSFHALGEAIVIGSLSLGLADDGITERALAFVADRQGTDPEVVQRTVTGAARNILQPLGVDSFSDGVVGAIAAFLRDPGRFAVSLAPQEPASISRIVMTALAAPKNLPQFLGITIEVRD